MNHTTPHSSKHPLIPTQPLTTAFPYFSRAQRKQILKYTESMLRGKEMLTMGRAVREFEEKFAQYCGVRHGIATNSCTSALNIVFKELKLKDKDEVIVPTQTFFANASSVLNAGAKLKLVDVNQDFMLELKTIESAVTPHTKAIVIVHFAGLISPDIFKIKALCKQKGISLIEDCSHAHGAIAQDNDGKFHKAGSIGDISVFSFFSTKILTCGEGGIILCNNTSFGNACRARANRGLDPESKGEHFIYLGENYRMAEFNAVLGLSGLQALESKLAYRNKLATNYKIKLRHLENKGIISFQATPQGFRHSFWRFIVFLHAHNPKIIIKKLKALNIHADAPYKPLLHKQPLIESLEYTAFTPSKAPTPQNHISLPMHDAIKLKDTTYIAQSLKEVLQ